MQSFLPFVRHHLKRTVSRSLLGLSFPDVATTKQVFLESISNSEIYRVRQDRRGHITRSGVVRIGYNFLTLDYGPFSAFRPSNMWWPASSVHLPAALPLWSHEWSTYYHWLIDVAPKLAAAKHHFGAVLTDLFFLYPGKLNSYQRETVQALGLSLHNVIDLHRTGGVTANTIYAMPLPGFCRVDPRLRRLRSCLGIAQEPRRRLYISRSGRRRIENEAYLFALLDRSGFEFIPDNSRALADQIRLFAEASHIVAPHGAALANLIWSSPETRILELANSRYSPDYFKVLAFECGMTYDRLKFGAGANNWLATDDNIIVDLDAVRRFLSEEWSL